MNYSKLGNYLSQLHIEDSNLRRQIEKMKRSVSELENRLRIKMYHIEFLDYIHREIFEAASRQREEVVVFMTLHSTDCPTLSMWNSLPEAHMSINLILREVGIKDAHIETVPQFRIRKPDIVEIERHYDSVISFPAP